MCMGNANIKLEESTLRVERPFTSRQRSMRHLNETLRALIRFSVEIFSRLSSHSLTLVIINWAIKKWMRNNIITRSPCEQKVFASLIPCRRLIIERQHKIPLTYFFFARCFREILSLESSCFIWRDERNVVGWILFLFQRTHSRFDNICGNTWILQKETSCR